MSRYLDDHWRCQICGKADAVEVHHILGRNWPDRDDERNLLAVCRPCHSAAGRHNPGKILSLHAKWRAGELDLGWYGSRPGYSVAGILGGKWRDELPELGALIQEILMDSTGPKEAAYDEHIAPLMTRIIEVCHAHKINAVAHFILDADEEDAVACTTYLPVDKDDELGMERLKRVHREITPPTEFTGSGGMPGTGDGRDDHHPAAPAESLLAERPVPLHAGGSGKGGVAWLGEGRGTGGV